MAQALFAQPRFHDDEAARQHLEAIRWPKGPACPHCEATERISKLAGESHRDGLYFCGECRQQFTVTVGTVFERSKVALHKWVLATHLMCSSKKGISAHQLHRTLGVTYKTAWFMAHRIREAMTDPKPKRLGRGGGTVEIDEAYVGGKPRPYATPDKYFKTQHSGHNQHGVATKKTPVVVLVERDGNARTRIMRKVNSKTLRTVITQVVSKGAHIMTDEHSAYPGAVKGYASRHDSVAHSRGEYARPGGIHSNTAESFFALIKRQHYGTNHHYSKEHMPRYIQETVFRWNNRKVSDSLRADIALRGIEGKRLTYRRPCAQA